MQTYRYEKLKNCVEKELFVVETTDGTPVYFCSGSYDWVNNYYKRGFKFMKDGKVMVKSKSSRTFFWQRKDSEDSHFLMDLDGKDVSKIDWKITRFSPLVKEDETSNLQTRNGYVFAQHAPHSKPNNESQSMISYWEENVGKNKTVDLDNFTCPCCGIKAKRDYIDGAHVKIDGKAGQYITPTCKNCNEYKIVTERYFKVKEVDVVKAP